MNLAEVVVLVLMYFTSSQRQEDSDCQDPTPRSQVSDRPFTIFVEGNVGSGKSTLLNFFRKRHSDDVEIVFEPVDKWQNLSNVDLLDKMFHDSLRWTGTFQLYSSLTRSVYSGRYCFLDALVETKSITPVEYALQDKWFELMTRELDSHIKPDLIIYLKCEPKVLMERIQKRGRPEEAGIDINFIIDLQRRHDDWLLYRNSSYPVPSPVMVMDGNLELESFLAMLEQEQYKILPQL